MQQELPFSFHSSESQRNELNYLAEESTEVSNSTFWMLTAIVCLLHMRYHTALHLQLRFNKIK